MPTLHRVLYPTDFSARSAVALAHALDLAAPLGAEIHVLHVAEEGSLTQQRHVPHELERNLTVRMREAVNAELHMLHYKALKDLKLFYHVRGGQPADEILAFAEAKGADLIVLGTHGRRGVRRLVLGSVAEAVMHNAPCPVMVWPGGSASRSIARIVVPMDFSLHAEAAFAHAKGLASVYGASVALLFVAEERTVPLFSDTGVPAVTTLKLHPAAIAQAEAALRQLNANTPGPPGPVSYHVRVGSPAREILTFAQDRSTDLIMMGTRGLEGLQAWLGSVADRVLRSAPCPVWTINAAVTKRAAQAEKHETALQPEAA